MNETLPVSMSAYTHLSGIFQEPSKQEIIRRATEKALAAGASEVMEEHITAAVKEVVDGSRVLMQTLSLE